MARGFSTPSLSHRDARASSVTFGEEGNARFPRVRRRDVRGRASHVDSVPARVKAAARFPSKNRDGIVAEIKTEFRVARGETDGEVLKKKLALARDGLDRLRAFSGLDQGSAKWEVSLKGPYDGA